MQCRECGFSVDAQALFCPNCGVRVVARAQEAAAADPAPFQPRVTAISSLADPGTEPDPERASTILPRAKAGKGSALHPGDVFAGRYRIEKFLGQGSLCNTYLCRDTSAGNREAVLKIMHARKAAEPGLPESFLFLAESVSKYDHKGIAHTYDWGRHESSPYYSMEWVSGVPLRMWLLERLTFENRVLPGLGILRSLLDTFEAIHERGCYGCLKPENVFVTLSGPVITDFGVVGFLSPQEFEFNAYARRYLPYMAPELRQDWSNLIPHSDYYSLGALLYEILVGRPPGAQLRLPSEMSDLFTIEADEIILKSMAPKPMDRFPTLEAFRLAVESLQASFLQARLEAQGAPERGGAGPEPADHVRPEVESDPTALHNPEQSFSTPRTGIPTLTPAAQEGPVPSPWSVDAAPQDAVRAEEDPYRGLAEADPDKTLALTDARQNEAAHAQRRFSRPIAPLPDTSAAPGAGPAVAPLVPAKAWEDLAGGSLAKPAGKGKKTYPPVPAWLWILLALLGCFMVVGSAYVGMFLPR